MGCETPCSEIVTNRTNIDDEHRPVRIPVGRTMGLYDQEPIGSVLILYGGGQFNIFLSEAEYGTMHSQLEFLCFFFG